MNIETLKWDSEFYGFSIGRIEINDIIDYDKLCQVINSSEHALLYLFDKGRKLDLPQLQNKTQRTVKLMDSKVIFRKETGGLVEESNLKAIRQVKVCTPELVELAYKSGAYSRFRLDDKLPIDKFKEMYKLWIKQSILGTMADAVFGSYISNELTGFVTIKINGKNGTIGLVAVDERFRGKGYGSMLMSAVDVFSIKKGLSNIKVATQLENIAACKFYESNGYNTESVEDIYHIWL